MMIDIDVIIYICGAIATVAAAVGIISKVVTKTIKKVSSIEIKKAMGECHDSVAEDISSLSKRLDEYIENSNQNDEVLKEALMNITRDRINQAHISYMRKKTIGSYSLATLDKLYESYKKLGGNSFIEREMDDIHRLKVVSAEEVIRRSEEHVGENQKRNA